MSDPYEAELGDDFDETVVDDPDEAEAEPDEAELEESEGEEPEGEAEEEPPIAARTRGDRRVETATRTAAEAKREAEQLRRELAELKQSRQAAPQESSDQRTARLAAMEPWERTEYLRQESEQRTEATLRQMQFTQADQMDKLAYESLKLRAPIASKLEADVEKRLADMRAAGTTAPRETVLRWVIGDRALANANRATSRAQKAAAGNRQRETARPINARGDQTVSDQRGGSAAAARAKRLEGYQL